MPFWRLPTTRRHRTYGRRPQQLDVLNETGLYELTPEDALKRVASGLSSYDNRLSFFRNNQALFEGMGRGSGTLEQSFADFNQESFEMLYPDPKRGGDQIGYVGLALTYPKGMQGVDIVNGFVDYVIERERQGVARDLEALIANRLAGLDRRMAAARASYETAKESQIALLMEEDSLRRAQLMDELAAIREELKLRREHRIQQLNEAISIAESLGIKKPTSPYAMSNGEPGASVVRTDITIQEVPLYFMGSEALSAERAALQARETDDFAEPRIAEIEKELAMLENNPEVEILKQRQQEDLYLQELASWREEAARLRGITVDTEHLQLVRLDQPALEPLSPVKPRKLMIVALGLVLGSMLGVFIALVRSLSIRRASPLAPVRE